MISTAAALAHTMTLLSDLPRRPPPHRTLVKERRRPRRPRRLTPAQQALVAAHVEDARRIALAIARADPAYRDADERISAAHLALVESAGTYDPDRGVPFRAYSRLAVTGEARRAHRDTGWSATTRSAPTLVPIDVDDRASVSDRTPDPSPGPADLLDAAATTDALRAALAALDDRERLVVVGLHLERIRQADLARLLRVSAPMVSRINRRALARLRAMLTEVDAA